MDKYLRYNNYFDGNVIPKLHFRCKILNKDGKIIGVRFMDTTKPKFDTEPVYIDIPIDNLYTLFGLSLKFINEDIDEKTKTSSIMTFSFFRQAFVTLNFSRDYATESICLNDDFSFIGTPPKNITSFYMPKCVLRYENEEFATHGRYKLFVAMNILHDKNFKKIFKPFHIEHFKFIDNNNCITVWMKTRLADKFSENKAFEKAIVNFCNRKGYKRDQLYLGFDNKRELLSLIINPKTDFGTVGYPSPHIVEQEPCASDVPLKPHKYRYGFNDERNKFFIIPDGGYNVFNHDDGHPKKDKLSDDANTFINGCSKVPMSLTYYFTSGYKDRIYVYIGMAPNMGIPFLEGISDAIDQCIETYDMELLHNIMVGECYNCDVDFLCRNGKLVCKMTKEYDADIYSFGLDRSKDVINMISDAYKNYFKGMDAEAEYNLGLFAFSLFVEI